MHGSGRTGDDMIISNSDDEDSRGVPRGRFDRGRELDRRRRTSPRPLQHGSFSIPPDMIRDGIVYIQESYYDFTRRFVDSINSNGKYAREKQLRFLEVITDATVAERTRILLPPELEPHRGRLLHCDVSIQGLPAAVFFGSGFGARNYEARASASKDLVDKCLRLGIVSHKMHQVIGEEKDLDRKKRIPHFNLSVSAINLIIEYMSRETWPSDVMSARELEPHIIERLKKLLDKAVKKAYASEGGPDLNVIGPEAALPTNEPLAAYCSHCERYGHRIEQCELMLRQAELKRAERAHLDLLQGARPPYNGPAYVDPSVPYNGPFGGHLGAGPGRSLAVVSGVSGAGLYSPPTSIGASADEILRVKEAEIRRKLEGELREKERRLEEEIRERVKREERERYEKKLAEERLREREELRRLGQESERMGHLPNPVASDGPYGMRGAFMVGAGYPQTDPYASMLYGGYRPGSGAGGPEYGRSHVPYGDSVFSSTPPTPVHDGYRNVKAREGYGLGSAFGMTRDSSGRFVFSQEHGSSTVYSDDRAELSRLVSLVEQKLEQLEKSIESMADAEVVTEMLRAVQEMGTQARNIGVTQQISMLTQLRGLIDQALDEKTRKNSRNGRDRYGGERCGTERRIEREGRGERRRSRSRSPLPRTPSPIRLQVGAVSLVSLKSYEQRRVKKGDRLWAQDMKTGKWESGSVVKTSENNRVVLQIGAMSWKKDLNEVYREAV